MLGLTWSGTSDAGVEQLRQLDPVTGNSTLIASLPGLEWVINVGTADPARGMIYVVGSSSADPRLRLFSINANSGTIDASPVIDGPYNWSGGIHLRSDGGLIGMTWRGQSDAGAEEVRTINPASGATSLVSVVPGVDWLSGGVNTADPVRDVIYAVAYSNADPRDRLFSIGAAGQVLANPLLLLDGGSQPVYPHALFTRGNGQLVGLTSRGTNDAGMQLRAINPASGVMTQLSTINSDGLSWGAQTIDRVTDQIYVIDSQQRLLRIDAATGSVLSSPPVAGWWSGLHLVR